MQEGTVTIGGETLDLPNPFMVIATQNPIEMEGTFALPEAQRDRFQFKLTVDLPDREMERRLLDRFDANPDIGPSSVETVVTPEDLEAARKAVTDVHIAEPVLEYILSIVHATRDSPDIEYGASPRASLTFLNAGKAAAAIDGRSYVIPDDIKSLAQPVLRHRLVLSTDAQLGGESVDELIESLVDAVPVPEEVTDERKLADQPTDD
jgi:MoxR-like ATPase